jgi:hypothetical protein
MTTPSLDSPPHSHACYPTLAKLQHSVTNHLKPKRRRFVVTMSAQTMASKRAGARVFGIIFQLVSLLVILGSCVAADIVAHLGTSVGVNSSHDPIVWTIIAAGLFAASVLAGFGYVLGMLCAIYDRQISGAAIEPSITNATRQNTFPQPPPKIVNSSPGPSIKETATWEFLTRERHFRKSSADD